MLNGLSGFKGLIRFSGSIQLEGSVRSDLSSKFILLGLERFSMRQDLELIIPAGGCGGMLGPTPIL